MRAKRQQGVYTGADATARLRELVTPVRACSACAGDYEDPGRTAWPSEDGDGSDEPEVDGEEFPAEK